MIPVYINVFNRLTTTRILCEQVSKLSEAVPIIIDNASTWEPLLDWYQNCSYEVINLRTNMGHHAPWISEIISQDNAPLYVVTDCDLDISDVPNDVLTKLQEPFTWKNKIIKSGLSLFIDDLPPWQNLVKEWESKLWMNKIKGTNFYSAPIDTTFAMYEQSSPTKLVTTVVGVPSVRIGKPYCAKHIPWYLDCENLDEENKNYFATANNSNSWKPNGKALIANYASIIRKKTHE